MDQYLNNIGSTMVKTSLTYTHEHSEKSIRLLVVEDDEDDYFLLVTSLKRHFV